MFFWQGLLNGYLSFTPKLIRNVLLPSDIEEFNSRLNVLFTERIVGFMEGELVKKWEKKMEVVNDEIGRIELLLKKQNRLVLFTELSKRKDWNVSERNLIRKRINEFKFGMECILDYLARNNGNGNGNGNDGVKVLILKGKFDWSKIYWMIKRECRRLDDELPIYADRRDILSQIRSQQVVCLNILF